MPIRLSGMVSGLDTDSIVKELVSAYSKKKEKIVKNQTKLEWKQEAWKDMNTKIYNFYSSALSKMRYSAAYTTKKSTSSDESIATVTAGSVAVVGTQTLLVGNLAKSSYLTGDKVTSTKGDKLSASSKLSEFGLTSKTTIQLNVKDEANPNGKKMEVTLSADMKISDLTKALKEVGVAANFDTTNQRFYISAAKSGASYNFDIIANDEAGATTLKNMGIYTASDDQKAEYQKIAGWGTVKSDGTKESDNMKADYQTKLTTAASYKSIMENITSGYESKYKDYQDLLDYQKKLAELKEKIDAATTAGDTTEAAARQTEYDQSKTEYDTIASRNGLGNYDPANAETQKKEIEAKQKEIADKYSSVKSNNGIITLSGIKEEALQWEYKNNTTLNEAAKKVLETVLGAAVGEDGTIKIDEKGEVQFGSIDKKILSYVEELQAYKDAYQKDLETSKKKYSIYSSMKVLLDKVNGGTALTDAEKTSYNVWAEEVGMDSYSEGSAADAKSKVDTEIQNITNKFASITEDADGKYVFTDKTVDLMAMAITEKTAAYNTALDKQIEFANKQLTADAQGASKTKKIDGEDAAINLNGVTYTSNTNSFNINGLTITAKKVNAEAKIVDGAVSVEGDAPIIIDTVNDTEALYNTIKDFIKQYNELMNAMDASYNAESASKYEPLTDEEKDSMSEKEVEKWEQKIKDSLLRRDSTLNSVGSAMRNVMRSSYKIGEKEYSLASFGIKTLSYFTAKANEKNAYHIDGDPDDANVSLNTDKLKTAIAEDPEAVMDFFQKLSTNMYSTLSEKMKSTTLSSAYTVYNDKQMKKEYDAYTQDIKKWEERVTAMEDKYYKQFAAMESALSKLQSSTASLTSLLGGGA